ncbi:FG-GAP-like repeat-containing protein [Anaerolineales bacterium HSG24]|nr:FG-GAP-like repeat-containing protein [Anaerolineales bacterium HSG24]
MFIYTPSGVKNLYAVVIRLLFVIITVSWVGIAYAQGPVSQSISPIGNTHTAPSSSAVSITYDQPISTTTVSTQTFAVHAMQTGLLSGEYSTGVMLTPLQPFKPGELVQVSATTGTLSSGGQGPTSSTVWQFWTQVTNGSGTFTPGTSLSGNDWTQAVAAGDLDNDGDIDLVVGNRFWFDVILRNDGSGSFVDAGHGQGSTETTDIELGDLNGDGYLDAIFTNDGTNDKVWFNDKSGQLIDSGQSLGTSSNTSAVALGDLDGDGDLDAYIAKPFMVADEVWYNDGTGNFSSGQTIGSSFSSDVKLGDLDGDGDLDAFVSASKEQVWLNDGQGNFTTNGQTLDGSSGESIALGDIDDDDDLDAVIGMYGAANKILRNDGHGSFTDSGQTLGSGYTKDIALGDIDKDGDLDILAINANNQANTIWSNNGSGSFTVTQSLSNTSSVAGAFADLDGNGSLDIFNGNDASVNEIWLNGDFSPIVAMTLDKTVGTASQLCSSTDMISVTVGTEVTYCYEVINTGNVTLDTHTLADNKLGTLLNSVNYTLAPGNRYIYSTTTTIGSDTINTAQWIASDGSNVITVTDIATVTVMTPTIYGVDISPNQTTSSAPGDLSYTVQITNTGNTTDTFDITTVSSKGWTTIDSTTVGPMSPNATASINVMVTIPTNVNHNDSDVAIITATSQTTPTVSDNTALTTIANPPTDTPTPTVATDTPTPTVATDTPTPTPTPTVATDTPTPIVATDTPTPIVATDIPTPTVATDTPTPTVATDTPTPTVATDTPTPTAPTDTAPTDTAPTDTAPTDTPTPTPTATTDTPTLTDTPQPAHGIIGRITDIDNNPLPDIEVILLSEGDLSITTTTTSSGNYAFSNLADGSYRVCYHDPAEVYVFECYNDALKVNNATTITIEGTDATGIDAQLSTENIKGSISGVVLGYDGNLLENVTIRAFEEEQDDWLFRASTKSDATGEYEIELSKGKYVLCYEPNETLYASECFSDAQSYDEAQPISVSSGLNTPDINPTLERGSVPITVSITSDVARILTPRVPEDPPVVHMYQLDSNNAWRYDSGSGSAIRDEDYLYRYNATVPTGATFRFGFEDTEDKFNFQYYVNKHTFQTATPLMVTKPLSIVVDFARSGSLSQLQGQVTHDGTPLADIEVYALREERVTSEWQWQLVGHLFDSGTTTDASGVYTITGLPRGNYIVYFVDPTNTRPARYHTGGDLDDASNSPITLNMGETKTVDIDLDIPIVPPVASAEIGSWGWSRVSANQVNGQITIEIDTDGMGPVGAGIDVPIKTEATCPNDLPAFEVELKADTTGYSYSYSMTPVNAGNALHETVIPGFDLEILGEWGWDERWRWDEWGWDEWGWDEWGWDEWGWIPSEIPMQLTAEWKCSDGSGGFITRTKTIGELDIFDPSGFITDVDTGEPVVGAVVRLYKLQGWTAKLYPGDDTAYTCQSHNSKDSAELWNQVAPTEQGLFALPDLGEISPGINPQITNGAGHYSWDVVAGCWYITIEAPGYETKVSPVVGVPPEVTDLNVALTPLEKASNNLYLPVIIK